MSMQEDRFVNSKAFKAAMQDWSVAGAHNLSHRYKNLDSSRNVVWAYDNRPFCVSAAYPTARQCAVVVSIGGEHSCIGAGQIGHGPCS